MVNVFIYLDGEKTAIETASHLLDSGMAAHVSIDKDNHSYSKLNGKIMKQVTYVLTLQTKAILFDSIVNYILNTFGRQVKIFSMPITQCNEAFSEIIRHHTKTE